MPLNAVRDALYQPDVNQIHAMLTGSHIAAAIPGSGNKFAATFIARDTRDVKSLRVSWLTVTTPGTIRARIETISLSTGQPTGTPYDANADLAGQTPAVGVATYQFGVLPTAGLVPGTPYAVVIETTGAGTAHTLHGRGSLNFSAGSNSTWVDTGGGYVRSMIPGVASLILEDDAEVTWGMSPYYTRATNNLFLTNAGGNRIIIPSGGPSVLVKSMRCLLGFVGSPAGDIRARIYNSADAVVASGILDRDLAVSLNWVDVVFDGNVATLEPGNTYYAVVDSPGSLNSSNCFNMYRGLGLSAGSMPANFLRTSTSDVTGTPIIWMTDADSVASVGLYTSEFTAAAGGGGSRSRGYGY